MMQHYGNEIDIDTLRLSSIEINFNDSLRHCGEDVY